MNWPRWPATTPPGPGRLGLPVSFCSTTARYLRFNDGHRTVSMQLPPEAYAQTKACVDAWAEALSPDGGERGR